MKPTRFLLPAFLAVAMMSGVTATSVSAALPEFYKGGAAIGATAHIKWTANSMGEGTSELTQPLLNLKCSASTSEGHTNGPKKVEKVVKKLTGCEKANAVIRETCTTSGLGAGEIETRPLAGELLYLNKNTTPPTVGILFQPETAGAVTTFKCGTLGTGYEIRGSVIGEVRVVNSEAETWKTLFETLGGNQRWLMAEGESAPKVLTAGIGCAHPVLINKEKMTWENMEKVEIKG
jgi:hypothetical protein